MKSISVIIPACNEAERITSYLREIDSFFKKEPSLYEIIVVNDGSRDRTVDVICSLQKEIENLRLICLTENRGKGFAIKAGFKNSKYDYLLFADADGSTPFREVKALATALDRGAHIALGSRSSIQKSGELKRSFSRVLSSKVFNIVVKLFLFRGIEDTQCGFKMFTRSAAMEILKYSKIDDYIFDLEVLILAKKLNFSFEEVQIDWHDTEGSKLNVFIDSFKMLRSTLKLRRLHKTPDA